MTVEGFESQYMQSMAYLVTQDGRGFIVDPAKQDKLTQRVDELGVKIDYIFLTHEHCDHIIGAGEIRERYGAPVVCTEACGENISDSRKNYSRYFEAFASIQHRYRSAPDLHVEPFVETADRVFEGKLLIAWADHEIELTATPGHTPGGMCILVDKKILFTGDTLFKDDDIMLDFMGGSGEAYAAVTEPWLKSLDMDTIVYPGHSEEFILGERLKQLQYGGERHE